ncbi:DNA polymerase III subunit psi [Vibrio sp. ZSDZ65]|uniref:DNA polymerase III subunit psi n=1 Tax=Vibrio qingdaonensis TaxID=2829491 RepID=A0A9X3CKS1_9VIBR|nr:DNA polymerase III subunit psi [Vibrio qingdaonensis]MCW8345282.1 DNA polymerase III subunit psi [Vibrio qingdaonensis]
MVRDSVKLQLMGIQTWALAHPERLAILPEQTLSLPDRCELLFISPIQPENETALFYQKILKAMKLEMANTQHIYPEQLIHLDTSALPKWLWFSGAEYENERYQQLLAQRSIQCNQLVSPLLSSIDGNDAERRALWNQIRSYA